MSKIRRVIRKTQRDTRTGFDGQFWPVIVALCLLAGFLIGAGITLLQGPWIWICLIGMPIGLGIAILAMACINHRLVRRSFQLALVLSLAMHVAFIIYARKTDVFSSSQTVANDPATRDKPKKKQKVRPRKIETYQWQQVNDIPTPEPLLDEMVEEKVVLDQSTQRPQPTPVERSTESFDPNVYERRESQRTSPRRGESLSKLSRTDASASATSATGADQILPRPAAGREVKIEVKIEVKTTSIEQEAASGSTASKSDSETPATRQAPASSVVQQTRKSQEVSEPIARSNAPAPSTAAATRAEVAVDQPVRAATAELLKTPAVTTDATSPRVASSRDVGTAVNRQTSEMTIRRNELEPTIEAPSLKPQQSMTARREVEPRLASIETNNQSTSPPRRTVMPQPTPMSPKSIENPRPSTIAQNNTNALDGPGQLAISRSTTGIAGIGKSQNLDRMQVASKRPALQPSNAADRQRAEQTQRPDLAFAPSKASAVPRSTASPQDVPAAVRVATPSPRASLPAATEASTLQASTSASVNDASSDARRGEVTASKGSAQIDIGPEKLVSGELTGRASGGGQPEPNFAVSNLGNASQKRSQLDASITVVDTAAMLASPMAMAGSESAARESQPDSLSVVQTREGGKEVAAASRTFSAPVDVGPGNLIIETSRPRRTSSNSLPSDEPEDLPQAGSPFESPRAVHDFLVETKADPLADGPALAASELPPSRDAMSVREGAETVRFSDETQRTVARAELDPSKSIDRAPGNGQVASTQPIGRRNDTRSQADPSELDATVAINGQQPIKRARTLDDVGPGSTQPIPLPASLNTEPVAFVPNDAAPDGLPGPGDIGTERRRNSGGIEVDLDVPVGPGGMAARFEAVAGIDDRRARFEQGPLQAFTDSRFVRSDPGGQPTVNTAAVVATDAFRARDKVANQRGGSPQTEESIELGLDFLLRHQLVDGNWTLTQFGDGTGDSSDERALFNSDTAATGLALLAFQGAGYNHQEYKYASTINRGIQWLLDHQGDDGSLYAESDEESNKYCRFYSHAIATLALCEAYGMTQDPNLRVPAQEAIRFIENSQDKIRGGWRYLPGYSSDTSVTGWMMMALKSGDLAGLYVSQRTYDGIRNWLSQARVPGSPHLFRYNPYAANTISQSHGRTANPTMTAVGLLMHLYFGSTRDDQFVKDGTDYILEKLPSESTSVLRDTYYWYYATQVLRHMDGERWEIWSQKLIPLLRSTQIKNGEMAGSWHPLEPVPDIWGQQAGRLYQTTMNLLSLEVDYRLLRLYDDTVK